MVGQRRGNSPSDVDREEGGLDPLLHWEEEEEEEGRQRKGRQHPQGLQGQEEEREAGRRGYHFRLNYEKNA